MVLEPGFLNPASCRGLTLGLMAAGGLVALVIPCHAQNAPPTDDGVEQRTVSAGVGQFGEGDWGERVIELVNHRNRPSEVVSVVSFEGDPLTQFARRVWIPANARRRISVPVHPRKDGQEIIRAGARLYDLAEDAAAPVRSPDESFMQSERLPRAQPPVTAFLTDWSLDESEAVARCRELVVAMRLAAGNTRNIVEFNTGDIPEWPQALDVVDELVLAGNQVAESPAGLETLCTWLRRGGRMWILLDQVELRTVKLLLTDTVQISEMDRVRLTEVTLHNRLKSETSGPPRTYDDPVDFMRVVAPDVEVLHEIDGWPASFLQDVGNGRVMYTTLAADAWMRPRLPHEQVPQLEFNSYFVAEQALDELAGQLTRPLAPPPLTSADFEGILSAEVGYRIPGRTTVLVILGLFWAALLGTGCWLMRSARLERLALMGPILAVLATVSLAALGTRAQQAIPPTAELAELVEVGPGTNDIHTTGAAALFVREPTAMNLAAGRSRLLVPIRNRLEGTLRQMQWTDLGKWHWEHLTLPTGLHFATVEQHTTLASPVRATATFGPDGLHGKLQSGPYVALSDAVIATRAEHALAVRLEPDGGIWAGREDLLEPGTYLSGALLTDEQRQRQVIYQKLLQPRTESCYPRRPMLLVWGRPNRTDLEFPPVLENRASALLAIPLELQPPVPGTEIDVPSPFLDLETLASGEGIRTTVYDPRTREWQKSSYPSATNLRFRVPRPLLPFEPTRGTLYLSLRAPLRTVELAAGTGTELIPIASLANAVGRYAFTGAIVVVTHKGTSTGAGFLETPIGDTLAFVIETHFDAALPGQSGTYAIVGGTGRFEQATGSGTFTAVVLGFDPVETLEFAFDGTIQY